tara:strand:+ start:305745 stop:306170 length:426 start_codon:yes stop_codon:yes gene_type:complete
MLAIFDIITIGFPFCAFKIITGLHFNSYLLLALGIIDLIINFSNLFIILFLKKRIDTCLLAFLTRKLFKANSETKRNWQDLGESLDVALSFVIVAYIIGSGEIVTFQATHLQIWNWSVVFNVLGAGIGRVYGSVHRIKQGK